MSTLLKGAVFFLIISIIAAIVGFGGLARGSADIAQLLFYIFLGICIVLFILGLTVYKSVVR